MALCALGLVTGDSALAGTALGELIKLGGEGNKDLHYEICYLFSRFYTLQGDPRLGLRHIVKAVHRHPDRAELWDQLAAFIVQVCPDDLQVAMAIRGQQSFTSLHQLHYNIKDNNAASLINCSVRDTLSLCQIS
ncbi:uncharacterized protein LOC125563110 [Nematostella vectensis]|uniref:uncharacterized protein LOC125563110 n=1 Tax=Nematostella vectensis TaxID=45351 RepID=UPI0020777955|nr:uncharacterized protein LOC125563110 [Nematostella vectensis]